MVTAAPVGTQSRWQRVRGPLLMTGGLAAATLALRARDPHRTHSWGVCPLYAATGIYCPGCGGLRAVNDITRGHIDHALHSNVLVTLAYPVGVAVLVWIVVQRWRGKPTSAAPRPWVVWTALVVALVFMVLRNTPYGTALAPV
ncbi:hypothetical protein Back2_05450 [Nocardioides baekrokdamisoli]|uniref:DUF2752 domain-containing protein n=1 Tax=Nocardioides baekrokdamisoli TaxID=1804624 RepID=A0A3G9IY78_9ACTN|nr:hypothetical protein Back2_05450 [Nocardioides baekrokdamisoli]